MDDSKIPCAAGSRPCIRISSQARRVKHQSIYNGSGFVGRACGATKLEAVRELSIPGHDLQVPIGQPKEHALAVARKIARYGNVIGERDLLDDNLG